MPQIRPNQIISAKPIKVNPTMASPRDLTGIALSLEEILQRGNVSTPATDGLSDVIDDNTFISPDTSNQIEHPPPRTPAILGVKSQTVGFQPDGTAKIDLVLIVEDLDGITEYDIRVAKDAGNL